MQQMTRAMRESIRGTYQVPLCKIEIYNQDGSLAGTINDVENVKINVAGSRKVLRTFQAIINNQDGQYTPNPDIYDRNFLWYNKTAKIFYGFKTGMNYDLEEYLPQGVFTIDSIKPSIKYDGVSLIMSGQDQISKLIEDKFDDVYKVEDGSASESANYALASGGALASATTSIAAGDEIQNQGNIHYVDHFAIINGVKFATENENTTEAKDPARMLDLSTDSGWRYIYYPKEGEAVSEAEAEIFVDLQSAEDLQSIEIVLFDGTELTDFVYVSADNQSYTSYSTTTFDPLGKVRFIKFKIRQLTAKADGSWHVVCTEIKTKTSNAFGPDRAIDGDVYSTDWRPKPSDPDPVITVDFGASQSINALYLYWGNNSFDFWNRQKYFMESSGDGLSWTRITDLNGLDESDSLFGDVEHVFNAITCRYIRINLKARDGVCSLRHIKAVTVTSTQTVDKVITDVATTAGITNVRIPKTRRFVKKRQADIGDEKLSFCRLAAGAIGWVEPYMDEDGVLTTHTRDINPVDLAWIFHVDTDNIFSFSPRFSNDIFNVIVVVYQTSSEKAIVGRASDDNPLSPTYTGTLGRRVRTYEGQWYDTQDKVDQYAQQKLFERTRFKHQTSIPVTGHPGIQVDDVVQVTVPEAKVENYFYLVTGFVTDFDAESTQFNTRINISQL
jgi:hypothetical protein